MNKLIISAFAAIISVASIGAFAADTMTSDTMTHDTKTHDAMAKVPAGKTHMPSTSSFSDLYRGH